ncbi:tetratricopeptide repeat protein [Pontibacter sp. E15-1]|uniref:tetratricopeptide repeat protein n=1 Tax=Pontibacter sp. E15-1 TaxID=2919918 RepID=UPI001F5007B9|nr:tetratricopeptide repeat protein [Pontibacter sp. E15-1]MCJ8166060.1 tetratricopeptide repeat protein [Pontibacter sp. E15-1]
MENYPNSYNVYSSMGQYYERLGDKIKAIEFYEKAVTIKEYPETMNKIVELRSSK